MTLQAQDILLDCWGRFGVVGDNVYAGAYLFDWKSSYVNN